MSTSSPRIVEFNRDGCIVSTICSDDHVLRTLEHTLSYVRKVYQHLTWELRRRGETSNIKEVPIQCYEYLSDPAGIIARQLVFAAGFLPRVVLALRHIGYEPRVRTFRRCGARGVFENPAWDRLAGTDWRWMQRETIELLARKEYGRVKCPTGWGKAQPLTAQVQTPVGPMPMGTLRVGDVVCTPEGGVTSVTAIHPQGEVLVYRITFADGDSVECCGDHLWEVDSAKLGFRRPKVLPTTELLKCYRSPCGQRNLSIRLPRPLEMPSRETPIPPYLLGVLLGDGGMTTGTPSLTSADDELVQRCRAWLAAGYELKQRARSISYGLTSAKSESREKNFYTLALQDLGLYGLKSCEKHIPDCYLYGDITARQELLRGLMDTDGSVNAGNGKVEFSTSSPKLAVQFKWLVESLGGICRVKPRSTACLLSYRFCVSVLDAAELFHLTRKKALCRKRSKYFPKRIIADIQPVSVQPAQCITVASSDGLYLTDHCVVTHNSFTIGKYCQLFPRATIVITTHSVDVLEMIYEDLRQMMPRVGIYSGRSKASLGDARVMCFSGKSLHNCNFRPDVLLADEIHEWATDDYLRIATLPAFHYSRKHGLSASAGDRPDEADFEVEGVFGPVLTELHYEDCVANGCVVPIEIHWRDVPGRDVAAMETDVVAKERVGLWTNDYRNRLIAEDARSFGPDEQVLIMVETIEHAMNLKKFLPEFELCYSEGGLSARDRQFYIGSGLIEHDEPVMTVARRQMLKQRFETGQLKKAIANSVWKRGVNFRRLQVLIRADGKASPISDVQIPGRTSRLCNETGKQVSIVIDYRDQFNRTFNGRAQRRSRNYAAYGWRQVQPRESQERIRVVLSQ